LFKTAVAKVVCVPTAQPLEFQPIKQARISVLKALSRRGANFIEQASEKEQGSTSTFLLEIKR